MKGVALVFLLLMPSIGISDIILEDRFDDGVLSTSSQLNGGFTAIGSGNGSVSETGGAARMINSSNKNDVYGMTSVNRVSLDPASGELIRTTWSVSAYDLKNKTGTMAFAWQADTNKYLHVLVDLVNEEVTFEVNGNTFHTDGYIDFGVGTNTFTLVAEFSDSEYDVRAQGISRSGGQDINFFGQWATAPIDPTGEFGTETYELAVLLNGNGANGVVADVANVLVESIPEPSVVSIIMFFGGGLIFYRRMVGRNAIHKDET